MKEIFQIKGMHCKSCEVLLEQKIGEVKGIQKVKADNQKNTLCVTYINEIDKSAIKQAVKSAGYSLGAEDLPVLSKNKNDYFNLSIALVVFLLIILVGKISGLIDVLNYNIGSSSSLAIVFIIGLTAGVSTCMALVGGLVLGVSAKYIESHPDATILQRFRPHLFFNLGRIVSYFVLGGAIGYLGSFFSLSGTISGVVAIVVGFVMLILGIQLLGLFPRFSALITLPKSLSKLLRLNDKKNQEYNHTNAFIMGAITFFLPCGFTQAMQVLAIQSSSFLTGALIMGVFALGTTPGLLGIGGITAIIKKGTFANIFFKFVGIILIVFAIFNLSNGYRLSNLKQYLESATGNSSKQQSGETVKTNGVQTYEATYSADDNIKPDKFTVKVGQPARIEILAKTNGSGCMGSVMIPGLVQKAQFFEKGKTAILEFTPNKTGIFEMTCAMGIKSGQIEVVN